MSRIVGPVGPSTPFYNALFDLGWAQKSRLSYILGKFHSFPNLPLLKKSRWRPNISRINTSLCFHCLHYALNPRKLLQTVNNNNNNFCGGRKTGEPGEKPLGQVREPTTNSAHMSGSVNRTRATAVGGERSHHCAIPASHPQSLFQPSRSSLPRPLSLREILKNKLRKNCELFRSAKITLAYVAYVSLFTNASANFQLFFVMRTLR